MTFKVMATVELRNKDGIVTKRFTRKLKSYVIAFLTPIHDYMANTQTVCVMSVVAAVSVDTYGIQVGTGTNAVTLTDAALQTKILDGSSSGKLNYGAVSVGALVTVGSTRKFTISRTFTNNSGADITVNEVSLYGAYGANPLYFMERSLLSFTITNGTSGTVTYTISITV